jgi:excisionase family DNA binding protein
VINGKNTEDYEHLLNVDQVACILNIPKSTIYKLCKTHSLPCLKIGKHWRFKIKSINTWLRDHEQRAG